MLPFVLDELTIQWQPNEVKTYKLRTMTGPSHRQPSQHPPYFSRWKRRHGSYNPPLPVPCRALSRALPPHHRVCETHHRLPIRPGRTDDVDAHITHIIHSVHSVHSVRMAIIHSIGDTARDTMGAAVREEEAPQWQRRQCPESCLLHRWELYRKRQR